MTHVYGEDWNFEHWSYTTVNPYGLPRARVGLVDPYEQGVYPPPPDHRDPPGIQLGGYERGWYTGALTTTTTSTSTTTDELFGPTTTTPYITTTTTDYWTTTVTEDFGFSGNPGVAVLPKSDAPFLLHTKYWPKYNDENLISHADDQIRQQGTVTTSLSELVSSPPHESTGYPVGKSIESYQGYKTVEVWIRQVHLGIPTGVEECTVAPVDNEEGTGEWGLLYEEQNIEELKIIEWSTAGSSSFEVQFIFRTKLQGYVDGSLDPTGDGPGMVRQYVHVAWHDDCSSV